MANSSVALTSADRALLRAAECWGGDLSPWFWDGFAPAWGERLRWAWHDSPPADSEAARSALFADHVAEARPDPRRVHPSWCLRGLRAESPAVQRAALAAAPPEWRGPLQAGLGLQPGDLGTDHPPHPEALAWARALWTERLVGGGPDPDGDPPVIRALTRLRPRELARLVLAAGLVKWALAGQEPPGLRAQPRDRYDQFRRHFAAPDARLRELARRDVAAAGRERRHARAQLGMVTIGRLLSAAEPYRVRWALQHLPYPVARYTRGLMPRTAGRARAWIDWESAVLRAAWDRLRAESRLPAESAEDA